MKRNFTKSSIFFLPLLLVCFSANALQLISPPNNSIIYKSSVTLTWEKESTYAYDIQVSTDMAFNNLIVNSRTSSSSITSYDLAGLIMDGKTYYWRVKHYGVDFTNPWSFTCAISVPYVVSMDRVDAASTLQDVGLIVGTESEEYSAYIPANHVIRQDPVSGTVIAPDTPINLTISYGPEPLITVPSLLGYTQSEAEDILTDFNLEVGTITREYSDTVPLGKVIRQVPPAGTNVNQGSQVNLVLSDGPELVPVPNLAGMTSTEASSVLLQKGLVLGVVAEQYSDTVSFGRVISQLPKANVTVAPGTSVSITISKGKAPVQSEGEGETPDEGEGEIQSEGEGEIQSEGEGEIQSEGEGEVLTEGEGETPAEGEGEDIETGSTCTGCTGAKSLNGFVGDWLLVGLALMGLAAAKRFQSL